MRGMATIGMAALLALAACAPEKDTPELRLERAEEVVALEVEHGVFDSALDRGANIALGDSLVALGQQLGRPTTDADKEQLRGILRGALAEFMTKGAWTKVATTVYAAHLTASELGDLATFYRTASGSKLLNVQSALATEMSDAAEKLFAENRESFEKRVGEAVDKAYPELAPKEKK